MWGFPKIRGCHFGSPNNEGYSIWGSILGLFAETAKLLWEVM